ncbi:MAG: tRNA dihydrouridine synthase [Bdellovibrionales bacterium]
MPSQSGPPLIQLAPMEGVLDPILRELLSQVGGVDRMVTEFIRVTDQLLPAHVFFRYSPELKNSGSTSNGTPVFVQLLGGQPTPMAENAAQVVELGAPGVDLNFGCPAPTVNRHDGGATLLKNPERVAAVVGAVRRAVPSQIPVTAKVRLGFSDKSLCREIAQAAESGGAAHLVVHARTKLEMYKPPAHWHFIREMQGSVKIPVLANGDIWTVEDYHSCVRESGTSRVALGRGLVARPTLANEIRRSLGLPIESDSFCYLQFLKAFFESCHRQKNGAFALGRVKQLLRYWSRDPEISPWFERVKTLEQAIQVEEFFAVNEGFYKPSKVKPISIENSLSR